MCVCVCVCGWCVGECVGMHIYSTTVVKLCVDLGTMMVKALIDFIIS